MNHSTHIHTFFRLHIIFATDNWYNGFNARWRSSFQLRRHLKLSNSNDATWIFSGKWELIQFIGTFLSFVWLITFGLGSTALFRLLALVRFVLSMHILISGMSGTSNKWASLSMYALIIDAINGERREKKGDMRKGNARKRVCNWYAGHKCQNNPNIFRSTHGFEQSYWRRHVLLVMAFCTKLLYFLIMAWRRSFSNALYASKRMILI